MSKRRRKSQPAKTRTNPHGVLRAPERIEDANIADDVDVFMDDEVFDSALRDMEARRALDQTRRVAADIEIDLAERGPLFAYVKDRRAQALEVLSNFASLDPNDAVGIAKAQADVSEYLRVCGWIHTRIEAADDAERVLQEDFAHHG